ncbi:class I SAM-dependent DNA methyltransferase [Methylomonas rapida]|uniref:Class I SAM-dependent methyltransferase n=1 Tax=Methylomonas rapida TaxID=2963939 RepID=A0ABY7GI19_9GAMM|nr:class I SAM-dependent methyltransferase [Methylomonas rapida]WAR44086.1 class I SAM-dependent methyltransferase [Methylomonas rapida]
MNKVFDHYARYYDLLYQDKDYAAEAAYVASHIQKCNPSAQTILELGCGTGAHAEFLARLGFSVIGVDMSQTMLEQAETRKAGLPIEIAEKLTFIQGDVRSIRTGEYYDAVISLFHVMSYQISNSDLEDAFATAATHLNPGGVFLFDFWYGPAVLSQKPETRERELENEKIKISRIAEPEMFLSENKINVNYRFLIEELATGKITKMSEKHCMRYLFKPELELFMKHAGFQPVSFVEWMTNTPMTSDGWSSFSVAKWVA